MSRPETLSETLSAATHADDELTASLTRIEAAVDRVVDQRDRYATALRDIVDETHGDALDAGTRLYRIATLARTALGVRS